MARLETVYKETILPALVEQFAYKSIMQAPRITKITLNMGVGGAVADKKVKDTMDFEDEIIERSPELPENE